MAVKWEQGNGTVSMSMDDGNFKASIRNCLEHLHADRTACDGMKYWDTSRVTDCGSLFWVPTNVGTNYSDWMLLPNVELFNVDLGLWNTSGCTTMRSMFNAAPRFNQPIGGWDVSRVTDMSRMFQAASAFQQDIGAWDTRRVTDMSHLFRYAALYNNGQNPGVAFRLNWDVSQVLRFQSMFHDAMSFEGGGIGHWDVSNARDDGDNQRAFARMFDGATKFNADLSSWNIRGARSLEHMFRNAQAFNQDLSSWNVRLVTDFSGMFQGAVAMNQTWCWEINETDNTQDMLNASNLTTIPWNPQDPSCCFIELDAEVNYSLLLRWMISALLVVVVSTCYTTIRGRRRKRKIIRSIAFRQDYCNVEEEQVCFHEDAADKSIFDISAAKHSVLHDQYFEGEEEGVISFMEEPIPSAPAFVPTMDGDLDMIGLERHAVDASLAIFVLSEKRPIMLPDEDGSYLT